MILKRQKRMSIEKQEAVVGYLFILPYLLGFMLLTGIPVILSFVISFTNMKYVSSFKNIKFVGFANFAEMLGDKTVFESLGRSLYYSVLYIPIIMILGLAIAMMINQKIYARNFLRTILFLPYIANLSAVAIVWALLLDPIDGPINKLLKSIGIANPPMWLMGQEIVIPTLVFIACWQNVALFFTTYLAALQGVPVELYEACEIDGGSHYHKFRFITLPMISPTTFFLLITAMINSLKNFSIIQILTKGGPGEASKVLSKNIVDTAFDLNRVAYATTQGLILFAILVIVTLIQWRGQKKWVNYM